MNIHLTKEIFEGLMLIRNKPTALLQISKYLIFSYLKSLLYVIMHPDHNLQRDSPENELRISTMGHVHLVLEIRKKLKKYLFKFVPPDGMLIIGVSRSAGQQCIMSQFQTEIIRARHTTMREM